MQEAFILIETKVGRADEVIGRTSRLFGVTLVEAVTGPYDVVARARAETIEDIRSSVVTPIQADPEVTRALLCPVGSGIGHQPEPIEPEPFAIRKPEPSLAGVGFWGA